MTKCDAPAVADESCLALTFRSADPWPRSWSGVPAGLARALESLGFGTRAVNAEAPDLVTRALKHWAWRSKRGTAAAVQLPEAVAVRNAVVRARLARGSAFDGIVQMGSDYGRVPGPYVTLDDMTVAQGRILPGSPASQLSARRADDWQERQRRIYSGARACLAASRWTADSIVGDYGIPAGRVHVVGFGRNFDPPVVERDFAKPRFLFVGLRWERKNGPMVLRAFAEVRRTVPNAVLDVVAEHPPITAPGVLAHGPLRRPDERRRYEQLWDAATCFVLPSAYEPYGIVYSEAGAAGLPVIATCRGGTATPVGSGGMYVNPDDERALTAAMIEMCDPERARAFADKGLARSPLFSWEAVARRVVRALAVSEFADEHAAYLD